MLRINHERKEAMTIIAKDSGEFNLFLKGHIFEPGDKVTFTVNSAVEERDPLIQIVVEEFNEDNNTATIFMTQEDTDLEPGDYLYDVQLDTADGRTDTVVGPAKFKVIGGVTY